MNVHARRAILYSETVLLQTMHATVDFYLKVKVKDSYFNWGSL